MIRILYFFIAFPLFARTFDPAVDSMVLVEDFEAVQEWNLTGSGKPAILHTNLLPAPSGNRHLTLSYTAHPEDAIKILPKSEYYIKGYVHHFRIYAKGTGNDDELFVQVRDLKGKTHLLSPLILRESSWKEYEIAVPPSIEQWNGMETGLYFSGFFLKPRRSISSALRLHLDFLRAEVRPHHLEPPLQWK